MKIGLFFILIVLFFPFRLKAQIENVIVETYYVSDGNDAADTTGGFLKEGSITYRIYIDLKPGCKLRKIYGDANHALKFSSTDYFFNNKADGQSFGKNFSKNRLQENTVALDSWLTLGQTTRIASKTYFGVLKVFDRDGSFIGGVNNDRGLMINTDLSSGIPLTTSDGMDTMMNVPSNWADHGFINSGIDSTIFGSIVTDSQFVSNDASLQNSGVIGVNPDSNLVLVAQLTTKGTITFELNVEVEVPGISYPIRYVAGLAPGDNKDTVKLSPFLKYPPECGCTNPDYLEYSAGFACSKPDSCRTKIKFGCKDSLACNFDPDANFNLPGLCCYPGYCNDRDLSIVCPSMENDVHRFILFPNPAQGQVTMQVSLDGIQETMFEIYNSFGREVIEKKIGAVSGLINWDVDLSALDNGLYLFRLYTGDTIDSKLFIKN